MDSNLELNFDKTVEMITDFHKSQPPHPSLLINNIAVNVVGSVKFMGTTAETSDGRLSPPL